MLTDLEQRGLLEDTLVLFYPYGGRDFRLTDVAGKVATEIFA